MPDFFDGFCSLWLGRAGGRAVDLGGPKFEIKRKSRCLQKSKLVNWGSQACRLGGAGSPGAALWPGADPGGWDEGYASSHHLFSKMFLMHTIFP